MSVELTTDGSKIRHEKIVWEQSRSYEYVENISSHLNVLNDTDRIISQNLDLSSGIDQLSKCIYNTAFFIFGRTINSKNQRKFKSPWFNKDCFTARQQFRKSHRVYRKNTSYINAYIRLSKKRHYVNTKKNARYSYNRQMRDKLTGLAKNNAKAFWNEINKARKDHDAKPSISNLQFFNYFKETFSGGDIFTNPDIENELHFKESSNTCTDLLDRESEVDDVKRAITE